MSGCISEITVIKLNWEKELTVSFSDEVSILFLVNVSQSIEIIIHASYSLQAKKPEGWSSIFLLYLKLIFFVNVSSFSAIFNKFRGL
jgi:hypothetical protein